MRNKSNKGFTLIELLIVIAIIGILAAVLIPNLLSARQRAFDTAAQSCAKAIATGQEINVIDNLDYVAVASGTIGSLEGTNVCDGDIQFANGSATDQSEYSVDVQHVNGARAFQVTEEGITTLGSRF